MNDDVFEVVLVARVPKLTGFPDLVTVDRLVVSNLTYTHEINRPGSANLGVPVRSLSEPVKTRLRDLAHNPSEVWIYYGDVLAWSGEIQTVQVQGQQTLTLNCVGLVGYLFRMGVTVDLIYSQKDQFTIAKGLVDHWQNRTYGNYGINTAPIGLSGVLRDRTYLRSEQNNIGTRITELAAAQNGFDFLIDPTTRTLGLIYPQSGYDLTAKTFLDERNIVSASIAGSVTPDDLVNEMTAIGTSQSSDGQSLTLFSVSANQPLRQSYGASWAFNTYDGVSEQSTLDQHTAAYTAARSTQLFQPGVTIMARSGTSPIDFHQGDVVSYSYDAGLGLQSGVFRIAKLSVSISEGGELRMGVEFV